MSRVADRLRAIAGWRRALVAAMAGGASVLAMAPFHAWPVLALTLPMLVWLIDGAVAHEVAAKGGRVRRALATREGRAATAGWWFGFGYFFAGLFWIGEAFLVEAETFAVFIPFVVTLMPAGLALFWALATGLAVRFGWLSGLPRLLSLAVMLAGAEWLRGHILTGFPWNVLGYALTWPLPLMQVSGLIGIYGLTLVTVVVLAAPLVLAEDRQAGRIGGRWWIAALAAPAGVLAAMTAYGAARLAEADPAPNRDLMVRIVQPSVVQREKWRPQNQERIFLDHIRLSHQGPRGEPDGAKGIKLIVWPEAAMPFLPLNSPDALQAIGEMLPPGTYLASGALRLDPPTPGVAGSRRRIYNSLIVFGEGGRPVATYDKTHLVPFGEYLPFQRTLEAIGLEQLTRLRGGFDTGVVPRPLLRFDGVPPMAPLVCYEAIFPGAVVHGSVRPAALLNVTNDGWFGNTTGPRQHLHQARVRAVEEGLPLLRAANNGISAVIDGRGRVLARLDLNVKGAVDSPLPPALDRPLYGQFGDASFGLLMIGIATVILRLRRRGVKGWWLL